MDIEIVWLAYDSEMVEKAWSQMTVRELYDYLINDYYRKRVDPRSMLFHSEQSLLLRDVETFMKRGAIDISIEQYLGKMFYHGEDEFPLKSGELSFDYRLISYFTSLRMADDYIFVEKFFNQLFIKNNMLHKGEEFSFFTIKSLDEFAVKLRQITVQEILDLVESDGSFEKDPEDYVRLVQNYIEFFNYFENNKLTPFFYNNQTDIKKWHNLIERQNERSSKIVNLAYKKVKKTIKKITPKKEEQPRKDKLTLASKLKQKRRVENLILGLTDFDPLIRQKACEYLGTFGTVEDVDHLLIALRDSESKVRQEAARALGEIGNKRAVFHLMERVLKDESISVVISSAQALSNIGDKKALLTLIEALTQGKYQLAVPIAFYPSLSTNKDACKLLYVAAENNNVDLRRQIAFILGELKTRESIERLSGRLEDEDREVKINAIFSLGRIGTKEAITPLKKISLKSGDEEIKRYTTRAISSVSARV